MLTARLSKLSNPLRHEIRSPLENYRMLLFRNHSDSPLRTRRLDNRILSR